MSDPLSFPVLAGSALTQAFGFLYSRLGILLDSRKSGARDQHKGIVTAPVLLGQLDTSAIDSIALAEHEAQLRTLADALSIYDTNPGLIETGNAALMRIMSNLRETLETIYGQRISFRGERAASYEIRIDQEVRKIAGEIVGLESRSDRADGTHTIIQKADEIAKGGRMTGTIIKPAGAPEA